MRIAITLTLTLLSFGCLAQRDVFLMRPMWYNESTQHYYALYTKKHYLLLEQFDRQFKQFPVKELKLDSTIVGWGNTVILPDRILVVLFTKSASYGQFVSLDGENIGERQMLFSLPVKYRSDTRLALSPDSTRVVSRFVEYDGDRVWLEIKTFDKDFHILDTARFDLKDANVENALYPNVEIAPANNGEVYVLLETIDKKLNTFNIVLMIYDPLQKNLQKINTSFEDVVKYETFVNPQNNLTIVGFYGPEVAAEGDPYDGVFIEKISSAQRTVVYEKRTKLSPGTEDLSSIYSGPNNRKRGKIIEYKGGYILASRAIYVDKLSQVSQALVVNMDSNGEIKVTASVGGRGTTYTDDPPVEYDALPWYDPVKDNVHVILSDRISRLVKEKETFVDMRAPFKGQRTAVSAMDVSIDNRGVKVYRPLNVEVNTAWRPFDSLVTNEQVVLVGKRALPHKPFKLKWVHAMASLRQ